MRQLPRRCAPLTLRVANIMQLRGAAYAQRFVDHRVQIVVDHLVEAASSRSLLHISFILKNLREAPVFRRVDAERRVVARVIGA